MFRFVDVDGTADEDKNALRRLWMVRIKGETIDRYNVGHRYNVLFRYEQNPCHELHHWDWFTTVYPQYKFRRGFYHGPFRNRAAKQVNRRSRHRTRIALRQQLPIDARQFEERLPYYD